MLPRTGFKKAGIKQERFKRHLFYPCKRALPTLLLHNYLSMANRFSIACYFKNIIAVFKVGAVKHESVGVLCALLFNQPAIYIIYI